MSSAVNVFGRLRCFCQEALRINVEGSFKDGKAKDSRVWLGDDVATFRSDHDSLSEIAVCGLLDGFQETSWDPGGALDAGFVVPLAVVVCWTILDPMT
jgi:hypothetical protein